MTDLDWWAATRYPNAEDDWRPATATGRHAYNEDAAETPIFHALSSGAWRSHEPSAQPARANPAPRSAPSSTPSARGSQRRATPDPVEAFRRDPLTMPIPKQAAASTQAARRAAFGAHALRPDGSSMPERSREPERTYPPERTHQPERTYRPERTYQPERAYQPWPERSREPERVREPERMGRREVSDSGRHHHRRPSISSLL